VTQWLDLGFVSSIEQKFGSKYKTLLLSSFNSLIIGFCNFCLRAFLCCVMITDTPPSEPSGNGRGGMQCKHRVVTALLYNESRAYTICLTHDALHFFEMLLCTFPTSASSASSDGNTAFDPSIFWQLSI